MLKIKAYPASHGDAFLISIYSTDEVFNIIVDGGIGKQCFHEMQKDIKNVADSGQFIDLLIITHIDDDHIRGVINLFEYDLLDQNLLKKVWFNSGIAISQYFECNFDKLRELKIYPQTIKKMSVFQGITLEKKLKELGCWDGDVVHSGMTLSIGDSKISVLSPDIESLEKLNAKWQVEKETAIDMAHAQKDYDLTIEYLNNNKFSEDSSIPNRSSIAFLLENGNDRILMLGDAHPSIVEQTVKLAGYSPENPLEVNLIKVSHHGSKGNTSPSLLKYIKCFRFLVSTNGSKHGLPDKECFSKIICSTPEKVTFYFNYPIFQPIFSKDEFEKYGFSCECLSCPEYGYVLEV
jgi:beta-lactamase superfamily II metal-dependent hydrolase